MIRAVQVGDLALARGDRLLFRGLNFTLQAGQAISLVGRNGAGKTSLLRAIAGQQAIASGSIQLDGKDITRLAPHERARLGVGFVPQGREIFPLLTVQENLETGYARLPGAGRKIGDEPGSSGY